MKVSEPIPEAASITAVSQKTPSVTTKKPAAKRTGETGQSAPSRHGKGGAATDLTGRMASDCTTYLCIVCLKFKQASIDQATGVDVQSTVMYSPVM
jgi:hypothetical protein